MTASKRALRKALKTFPETGDDQRICEKLLAHPWFRSASTVMAFCRIPPEPDLTMVLEEVLRQNKALLLPRCGANGDMTVHRIWDLGQLQAGAYGILEPAPGTEIFPTGEIELILTPGLAFAPNGARLGRGKGYYDRFIPKTKAKTIGVCYGARLLPEIPVEPHDWFVDAVITDK